MTKSRRRKPAVPKRASGTEANRHRNSSAAGSESEIARLAHDLNDALERETAASEVLKIISSAQAASVQPVLDTVVSNAARLCRALNATIYLCEDGSAVIHAQHGQPGLSPVGTRRPINRDWVAGAAILDARPIQVADLLNSKDYPAGREIARRLGHSACCTSVAGQDRYWRYRGDSAGSSSLFKNPNCVSNEFRRASGHSDRERATAQ